MHAHKHTCSLLPFVFPIANKSRSTSKSMNIKLPTSRPRGFFFFPSCHDNLALTASFSKQHLLPLSHLSISLSSPFLQNGCPSISNNLRKHNRRAGWEKKKNRERGKRFPKPAVKTMHFPLSLKPTFSLMFKIERDALQDECYIHLPGMRANQIPVSMFTKYCNPKQIGFAVLVKTTFRR